jgi:signal transduction histidine kinase
VVEVADGVGTDSLPGTLLQRSGPLASVLDEGTSVVVAGHEVGLGDLGSVLVVPMRAASGLVGALAVGIDARRGAAMIAQDEQMTIGFAQQAALTLEIARAQSDRARLAVYEDRDRIGRDLHDLVVQRIFAVGLSLRNVGRLDLPPEERNRRIAQAVDDLDATVKDVRRSIFQLHTRPGEGDLRADLEGIVASAQMTLGFVPDFSAHGSLRSVPDAVVPDLVAVLRESLSNAARHAAATRVEVCVEADEDEVTLTVTDDGRGIGASTRRSGLANIHDRAAVHGGTCVLTSGEPSGRGTRVEWRVPVNGD